MKTGHVLILFAATACAHGEATCTLADCAGRPLEISFVGTDAGSVTPRGQVRKVGEGQPPLNFDCSGADEDALPCPNNVLSLSYVDVDASTELEVRFELEDGSISAWQQVSLERTPHTISDFNGPGCPCTYYEGIGSVAVPPGAA